MNDFTPSITDTLYVWDILNQAKDGVNPYGMNVAEVYVKHLMPNKFEVENETDAWRQASKNLHTVLKNFCDLNCVKASVNGKKIGKWMNTYELRHKCDVMIYTKKSRLVEKQTKKKGKKKCQKR